MSILPYQLPWYLDGLVIGLVVIGMYAVMNERLGVTSSYRAVARTLARHPADRWRVWFFYGLALGALLVPVLRGDWRLSLGYGALGVTLPLMALVPLLLVAGMCMGYGARWAGGCTSGHGISGTASRSPGSWAALLTFMVVAVLVSLLLHAMVGGAL